MEDKRNEFNDHSDSHLTSEEMSDDAMQNDEARLENSLEESGAKEEAAREEGASAEEQEEAADGEEESAAKAEEGAIEPSLTEPAQNTCSCSYEPPYYTPNLTVQAPKSRAKKEKKNHGRFVAALAICLVLCIGASFVSGGFAGYVFASLHRNEASRGGDGEKDSTTHFIKNDGSITIKEEVGSTGYSNLTVAEVVALVADSVVEITTSQVQTDPFYGNYVTGGAGSGVIISENGYIITNQHVVEGADSITVRLRSGQEFTAELIGGDADVDIAVLKINATGLSFAVMGKSSELLVGEEVVAIGNPLGQLGGTVTDGIISATDRRIAVDGHLMTLLQTNAAINPGNSGGGLFDMAGQLIGIVNAKQSDTGIEGLGFAIPIDVAYDAAKDIMEFGYVKGKPTLGFSVEETTTGFVDRFVRYPAGIYVVETTNKDLAIYDRIVSMNGVSINSLSDYYAVIAELKIGDELEMTVSRYTNLTFREVKVTLTVAEYTP